MPTIGRSPIVSAGRRGFALLLAALLLSSCMLVSGQRSSADAGPAAGNVSTSFVSAEGAQERTLDTGLPSAEVNVIVIVSVDQGELKIDMLQPIGVPAFSLQSRPGEQITRSGLVMTGPDGKLRYRFVAQGARNGGFQILYQRS